jgi:hypothetical protein
MTGLEKYLINFNMTYENLINTVSVIVENEKILKEGLTLVYELEKNHKSNE